MVAVASHRRKSAKRACSRIQKAERHWTLEIHTTILTVMIKDKEAKMSIDMAKGNQMTILHVVMKKIHKWINCSTSHDQEVARYFTPLRLTVRGSASAGKSFFMAGV